MSHNLQNCLKELELAMRIKDKQKRLIVLSYLAHRKCIYMALREIALNIIKQNIPLNRKQSNKLSPYAKVIKSLADGVKSKRIKRELVVQSGGFLPWLIPIIGTAITTAIDLMKK